MTPIRLPQGSSPVQNSVDEVARDLLLLCCNHVGCPPLLSFDETRSMHYFVAHDIWQCYTCDETLTRAQMSAIDGYKQQVCDIYGNCAFIVDAAGLFGPEVVATRCVEPCAAFLSMVQCIVN